MGPSAKLQRDKRHRCVQRPSDIVKAYLMFQFERSLFLLTTLYRIKSSPLYNAVVILFTTFSSSQGAFLLHLFYSSISSLYNDLLYTNKGSGTSSNRDLSRLTWQSSPLRHTNEAVNKVTWRWTLSTSDQTGECSLWIQDQTTDCTPAGSPR